MILTAGGIVATAATFNNVPMPSLAHVRRLRTEDCCSHHAVHVEGENPLRLAFVENFADPGACGFIAAVGGFAS